MIFLLQSSIVFFDQEFLCPQQTVADVAAINPLFYPPATAMITASPDVALRGDRL